jgi:hypothetical protein
LFQEHPTLLGRHLYEAEYTRITAPVASNAPDSPSAIRDIKRYLLDFDRLQQTTASDEELFNQMSFTPLAANQSWLMFGFPSG